VQVRLRCTLQEGDFHDHTARKHYEELLPVISTIPAARCQSPTIPPGVHAQEALDLSAWANRDKDALQKAGLTLDLIDHLSAGAAVLSQAQANWNALMKTRADAMATWKEESPEAYELRDELLHAFRYAFRTDDQTLSRVSAIADGSSDADMIQDLNDLAALGKQNAALLEKIRFDMTRLDTAALASHEMGKLRAEATADPGAVEGLKTLRDQAYTYLKEAVDEVRACGQYVFWRNPERRDGYASAYLRRTRRAAAPAATPTATE